MSDKEYISDKGYVANIQNLSNKNWRKLTMSDLIDRKKTLDEISKIDTSIIPSGWVKGYVDETIKETQRIIRTISSAEPDNQVHLCDSCHYCYPVCPAMNNDIIFGNGKGHDNICACAKYIPSAGSVQTSKVIIHKYWSGVSLNVVGEQTIGYEWICENCKKMVVEGDEYCSHCGARLDWGGNE